MLYVVYQNLPTYSCFANLTSSKLNESCDHDDEECQEFGIGEDVLNKGCPFHLPAIDESQHT
jgi:hypothetical protein